MPNDLNDRYIYEINTNLFFVSAGNGSYEYDNKFFKYEGQWKNGKKHGKLIFYLSFWILYPYADMITMSPQDMFWCEKKTSYQ